jgi:hypothetical protein
MRDDVADALDTDIVLPISSVKRELPASVRDSMDR